MKPDEVTAIKMWIQRGASATLSPAHFKDAPPPKREVTFATVDQRRVAHERAPIAAAVARLQSSFPGVISYQSRGSADLDINASLLRKAFGDRDLESLAPLFQHIVSVDLSDTAITDASIPRLLAMKNLERIRAANTDLSVKAVGELTEAAGRLKVIGLSENKRHDTPQRGDADAVVRKGK